MSVFDDDEQEESTPGARVAAALNAVDEEEPADDGPDTRADSQKDATEQAQKDAPNDTTAQRVAETSPYEGVSHPPDEEIKADDEPASDDQVIGNFAGYKPVTAPRAPDLQPLSEAPMESAQQLAQAKEDFAGRQARGDFRPSVGRRIGASIAAGLVGFGTRNPGEALNVAHTVNDEPFNRANEAEQAKEQAVQSQIDAGNLSNQRTAQQNSNAMQKFGLEERQFRDQGYANDQNAQAADRQAQADARRNAITNWTPKDPNNPYLGGTGRTADGRTVSDVPPPDKWVQQWAKTPEGQAAALRMTVDARRKVADSIFGKGNTSEKQEYVATGKISRAANVKIPSAQLQEYQDWKASYRKEHGHDPNAAEIAAFGHTKGGSLSKNLMDRIESQKNTQLQKAQQEYRTDISAATTPEAQQQAKDDYLTSWQEAQDEFEQRIQDASGEDVPHVNVRDNVDPNTLQWHGQAPAQPKQQPQQGAPKQAAAPQQQTQAKPAQQPAQKPAAAPQTFQYKGQTFSVNQKVNVNGKPAVITGFNSQTGKPIVQIQGQ